jgi:hypothetical protein
MLVEQEKLNSSATVTVEVVDINDNNPVFIRDSFTAELQETAIPGTYLQSIYTVPKIRFMYSQK